MEEMTIARGLTRLKTIKAQIQNNITLLHDAAISSKEKSRLVDSKLPLDKNHAETKAAIAAAIQQTHDLIQQFIAIKAGIAKANESTQITVAGKTMTIAEAMVLRRDVISMYSAMTSGVASALARAESKVERHNAQVLSSNATDKDKEILLAQVVPFVNVKDFEVLRAFETTFMAELDGTLNEVNAVTKFTIG